MPAGEATRVARHTATGDERDAALAAALDGIIPRYAQTLRHTIAQEQGPERLTMPQLRLLQAMAATERGAALTTHLARRMDVTAPTMTSRIDGLVDRGFVVRRPDPANRRQIHLVLTPAGYAHLERCQALIRTRLRGLLAHLSDEQKDRLMLALDDMAAMLAADSGGESGPEDEP